MIRDEFGLSQGAQVAVLLPAHWQPAAVLLGVWWAGAEVLLATDSADLALCTVNRLDECDALETAVLSLDAFGAPVRDLPVGVTDYATSVRVHGDHFRPTGAGTALAGLSVTDVLTRASESAAAQGVTAESRVMSSHEWDTPAAMIDSFLSVLAAGASLCKSPPRTLAAQRRRLDTERVTVQI